MKVGHLEMMKVDMLGNLKVAHLALQLAGESEHFLVVTMAAHSAV